MQLNEQPSWAIIQVLTVKVPNRPKARLMSLFDYVNEYLHFHTLALGEAEGLSPQIP